jgi:hypothetical protein
VKHLKTYERLEEDFDGERDFQEINTILNIARDEGLPVEIDDRCDNEFWSYAIKIHRVNFDHDFMTPYDFDVLCDDIKRRIRMITPVSTSYSTKGHFGPSTACNISISKYLLEIT